MAGISGIVEALPTHDGGDPLLEVRLDPGGQPGGHDDREDRVRVGVGLRQGDRDAEEVGVEDRVPELRDDVVRGLVPRGVVGLTNGLLPSVPLR